METIRKSPMLPPREVNLSPWTSPHTLSGATWLESNRGIHAPWLQASERWSPHYWQSSREPWLGLPGFPGSTAGLATVVARSELDMGLSLSCSIFYVREHWCMLVRKQCSFYLAQGTFQGNVYSMVLQLFASFCSFYLWAHGDENGSHDCEVNHTSMFQKLKSLSHQKGKM